MSDSSAALLGELFHRVDGQTIAVGQDSWWLHVYSLQRMNDHVCVQLAALGSRHVIVTLALPIMRRPLDSAVRLIARFLEEPDGNHPYVIDATPLSAWAAVASCSDVIH
jgi:hypothetical protein